MDRLVFGTPDYSDFKNKRAAWMIGADSSTFGEGIFA
jgi:hypothetical protein